MPSIEAYWNIDAPVVILGIMILTILFSKKIRTSDTWNATVTPLASIIGSGFLVVAPMLWLLAGYQSVWLLTVVVIAAYGIGSVIRFNIEHVEPYIEREEKNSNFKKLNHISYITLGLAYIISVTFYIRILGAFALKFAYVEDAEIAKLLTTVILLVIGLTGYFRGFNKLEQLEVYSVNIKISIIAMFVVGLFLFDWKSLGFQHMQAETETPFTFNTLRKVFGILLIVQGFEISRYIGHKYEAKLRVQTMKIAQIISGAIYLLFTYLILYLMSSDQQVNETAIIDLSRKVSHLLPAIIMVGAIFSQFSAAVADTVGCGGIVAEYSKNRISLKLSYLLISFCCIVLVWVYDVFAIMSLASKMFAAYYFTQCLEAIYANHACKCRSSIWTLHFTIIAGLMFAAMIFGIPAD